MSHDSVAETITVHLVVNVEQHEMIATSNKEVLSRRVGMHNLVLRPIEYSTVDRQHRCDAEYFLGTFVPTDSQIRLRVETRSSSRRTRISQKQIATVGSNSYNCMGP